MSRIDVAPPVLILRNGYATEALWQRAIADAIAHKCQGAAIDAQGRRVALEDARC